MTDKSGALLSEMSEKAFVHEEGAAANECLSIEAIKGLAKKHKIRSRQVSVLALRNGIVPTRYIKNIGTIGAKGQARLLDSSVLIVGAGGIGGRVAELLTRMGVGAITLVDPDVFDESNLNRQDFSDEDAIGQPKVEVVKKRLARINGDVEIEALRIEGNRNSLSGIIKDGCLVIDALDNIDDRLELEALCKEAGSILIHGAIAGSYLQAMTVFPGDPGLSSFFRPSTGEEKSRGIELETGNPSTTPAVVASIQAHEAINILAGKAAGLRGRLFYMDLDSLSVDFMGLPEE